MLSRLAREFAAEIAYHDWSDAPYRIDRAGHRREHDTKAGPQALTTRETDAVRLNAAWVAGQVLKHADPNLDPVEFVRACFDGHDVEFRHWLSEGGIRAGIRTNQDGTAMAPGGWH